MKKFSDDYKGIKDKSTRLIRSDDLDRGSLITERKDKNRLEVMKRETENYQLKEGLKDAYHDEARPQRRMIDNTQGIIQFNEFMTKLDLGNMTHKQEMSMYEYRSLLRKNLSMYNELYLKMNKLLSEPRQYVNNVADKHIERKVMEAIRTWVETYYAKYLGGIEAWDQGISPIDEIGKEWEEGYWKYIPIKWINLEIKKNDIQRQAGKVLKDMIKECDVVIDGALIEKMSSYGYSKQRHLRINRAVYDKMYLYYNQLIS